MALIDAGFGGASARLPLPVGFHPTMDRPQPHQITGALVNAAHQAVALHPDPGRKTQLAKVLAILMGEQAKDHAAGAPAGSTSAAGQGGYGGTVAEQTQGAATPMVAVPHERVYQPLLPEDSGYPVGEMAPAPPPSLIDLLQQARGQRLGGVQMPLPTGYPTPLSAAIADAVRAQGPPRY